MSHAYLVKNRLKSCQNGAQNTKMAAEDPQNLRLHRCKCLIYSWILAKKFLHKNLYIDYNAVGGGVKNFRNFLKLTHFNMVIWGQNWFNGQLDPAKYVKNGTRSPPHDK